MWFLDQVHQVWKSHTNLFTIIWLTSSATVQTYYSSWGFFVFASPSHYCVVIFYLDLIVIYRHSNNSISYSLFHVCLGRAVYIHILCVEFLFSLLFCCCCYIYFSIHLSPKLAQVFHQTSFSICIAQTIRQKYDFAFLLFSFILLFIIKWNKFYGIPTTKNTIILWYQIIPGIENCNTFTWHARQGIIIEIDVSFVMRICWEKQHTKTLIFRFHIIFVIIFVVCAFSVYTNSPPSLLYTQSMGFPSYFYYYYHSHQCHYRDKKAEKEKIIIA